MTFIKTIASFVIIFCSNVLATELTIVTEHLAPYQIVSTDSISGLSTEIVTATLEATEYEFRIEANPWSLSFNRAKREQNTCIYSLARLPQRDRLFQWIGHIARSTISFYALKNKPVSISSLHDAKKYKTAVIKDDVTHQFLLSKGFVENDNLYVMNNYDALLTLLEVSSRNIDLVIINDDLIIHRLNNSRDVLKYKKVHMIKELILDFHLACSLNTEQRVVDHLISTMQKLEQQGIFSTIREKWQTTMISQI